LLDIEYADTMCIWIRDMERVRCNRRNGETEMALHKDRSILCSNHGSSLRFVHNVWGE
jgi:hypothetical protein